MNGLPDGFDPSFFVGRAPQCVTIGRHTVQLVFHDVGDDREHVGRLVIAIECGVRVAGELFEDARSIGSRLLDFLDEPVRAAVATRNGTLTLDFRGGRVEVLDSVERYESYVITHGQTTTVV